jgi:hypothetical protein
LAWDVHAWVRNESLVAGRINAGTLVSPSLSGSLRGSGSAFSLIRYCADLRDVEHPFVQLKYQVTAMGIAAEDVIPLQITPCNYGGSRIWFLCPTCHSEHPTRCTRLYLSAMRPIFGCRRCHRLVYRSSQQSRHPSRVESLSAVEGDHVFRMLGDAPMTRELFRQATRAIRRSTIR